MVVGSNSDKCNGAQDILANKFTYYDYFSPFMF